LGAGALHRKAGGVEGERIRPIVQGQRVCDRAGADDLDQGMRELGRQQIDAGEEQSCGAICIRGNIEHIERRANHAGLGIGFGFHRLAKHGFGIMDAVGVRGEREAAKSVFWN